MRSKGFTLVELLAVIVVLAIILAIAIPGISGVIESSKKGALKADAGMIQRAAVLKLSQDDNYDFSIINKSNLKDDLDIDGNNYDAISIENNDGKITVTIIKGNNVATSSNDPIVNNAKVYGLSWDGEDTFTRTDDAVSLTNTEVATGNVDVTNDFDNAEIYSEMIEVIEDGNHFVKIPKFYIKKTVNGDAWTWQVSKSPKDSSYYLPACFVDETNGKILPYVLVGKYNASLGIDDKLESKPDKVPLIDKNITQFRTYARNNNNGTTIKGYQIMDLHVIDVLQTLFYIEFATLDSQSIMYGFTNGLPYISDNQITAVDGNIITVPSGVASNLKAGQMVCVESSKWSCNIRSNWRVKEITGNDVEIEEIAGISTSPGTLTANALQVIRNAPYITGRTSSITLATSGSEACTATDGSTNGECAMMYRGVENFYGNVFQFVDGINIKDRKAYVAKNADNYAVDTFSDAHAPIGYTNADTNNYVIKMGYDSNNPFIHLPIEVGSFGTSKYKEYYWQDVGNQIAFFGGRLNSKAGGGASRWSLSFASTHADYNTGGRLIKAPL